MVTAERLIRFILMLPYQSYSALSLANTPFFKMTLPNFFRPGILIVEKVFELPARYSITWVSVSSPDTSWNGITLPSMLTEK